MALSSDLISQFVKVTKDDEQTNKETTVYGETVEYNGSMYVKLDGSDLLTPISTTVDTKAGERVAVLIKNHTATVTGNVSSPAARTDDVKEIGNQITEFEIIIADKVSTQELEVERGRIDELVSDNATIKGTLTANEAEIENLKAEDATINGKLTANEAEIETLKTTKLDADVADLTYATITDLEATNAEIYNLEATYGEFSKLVTDTLDANDASIKDLSARTATIENAYISEAEVGTMLADYAKVTELEATNANVDTLEAKNANIESILAGNVGSGTVQTIHLTASNSVIDDGIITNAMIANLAASKITSGTIYTNLVKIMSQGGNIQVWENTITFTDTNDVVRIQIGEDASGDYNLYLWNAEGKLLWNATGVTEEGLNDGIIKDVAVAEDANISGSKLNITSVASALTEDGSLKVDSTQVTIDNATLSAVYKTLKQNISDLSSRTSTLETSVEVVQGQISSKIWQSDIETAVADKADSSDVTELSDKYTALNQTVNSISAEVGEVKTTLATKADGSTVENLSSKVSTIETTVSGIETNVSELETTVSTKADGSTVTELSNKYSTLSQTVNGISTNVTTNTTDISSLKSRVSSAETNISQNSEQIALRATKTELTETLGGYYTKEETDSAISVESDAIKQSVSETYTTKEDLNTELEAVNETIKTQRSEIVAESNSIILSALEEYVKTGDFDEYKSTVETQLSILADRIEINFTATTEQITEVDGEKQAQFDKLYKYISFSGENGIVIGSGENSITLTVDTDGIVFSKNGEQFGFWDGVDFYTGNIVVQLNERAQFGNFAFVPRSDGSLSFLKVGG